MDLKSILFGASVYPALWLGYHLAASLRNRIRPDTGIHEEGLKVVITGSTKGLGLALAREFLRLGDSVVISSRSADHCRQAHQQLLQDKPKGTVLAEPCDVTQPEEVQRLAQQACDQLGSIDIWVNNAGQSQSPRTALTATPASTVQQIVGTNLVGALLGSQAAMAVMQQQDTGGKIFLVDGAGSTGRATSNSASYGASKAAMPQLAKSLAAEARRSKVSVHICSPGMVATDLLLQGVSSPRAAQIVNILAEDAHVVAAWLCPRMRGVTGQGKYFRYLTPAGALWRFLTFRGRKNRFLLQSTKGA